ncbi:hypothetical protein BGZ83_009890 [Gryganskiella cystojenkinii]|nr:hypothetical protein BGZ83_009890 [Gryganskiella cystojenkinii]
MSASQQRSNNSNNGNKDLYPQVNRVVENHGSHGHTHNTHAASPKSAAKPAAAHAGTSTTHACGKDEWDLHPKAIRDIENHGSAKDVKALHDLEHRCERAEHQH